MPTSSGKLTSPVSSLKHFSSTFKYANPMPSVITAAVAPPATLPTIGMNLRKPYNERSPHLRDSGYA